VFAGIITINVTLKKGAKNLTMDITTPKYLLVENHIKKAIKQRKIIDKLPGERGLAKELGISYMTIRKAIDNLVNEGVLYKIPTKGTYVADPKAQKKKTKTIGYFLDSSIVAGLSSPYYSLIFEALEKEATRHGYSLVYFSDNDPTSLKGVLKKLDGVIASCFRRIENIIQEIKDFVPVVVIDNSAADKTIPSVIIDNFSAQIESVDHLCTLGHQRIGFMTGLEDSDVGRDRFEGYKSGLSKQGITIDEELVFRGNYSFQSGISGAEYFLSLAELPTAIICANDSMALGAINKLYESELEVPGDVSVVGFDDIDVASQNIPPLTTISAPINDIAVRSFNLLEHLIVGKTLENRHVTLAASLAIRGTSAQPLDYAAGA
jgi:DNA-binding LacI/PurR family transcriptional regulator